jgi:hypothetical protein
MGGFVLMLCSIELEAHTGKRITSSESRFLLLGDCFYKENASNSAAKISRFRRGNSRKMAQE